MKNIKYFLTILSYLFIVIVVVASFSSINSVLKHKKIIKKVNKEITISKVINEDSKTIFKSKKNQGIYNYTNFGLQKINLDDIKKINQNTIGFVSIPSTKFSFLVMNNDFYKNHNLYKNKDKFGLPYIYNNNKNLQNQNNIVIVQKYLFSEYNSLKQVFNKDFLNSDKNFVINLQINDTLSIWQIISINKTKNFKYNTTFKKAEFKEYINNLLFDSKHDFSQVAEDDEKLLTIVLNGSQDYVVTSKLIKMQKV